MKKKHLVLWDGNCGFCRRSAAWLQRRDRNNQFEFVPYQEAPSPPMTPALRLACDKQLHLIEANGRIRRGGRAVMFAMEKTGWGPFARFLARSPLMWFIEFGYQLVARNRILFSKFMFRDE